MEKEESEYEYKRGWENGAYITRLQNETNWKWYTFTLLTI
jgi:hypothetical protein